MATVSAWSDGATWTQDGTTKSVAVSPAKPFQISQTFKLGGNDLGGSNMAMTGTVRFGGLDVYQNGVLAMSLVPARNGSNIGMYDKISDTMLYPTNGSWTFGHDID